MAEIEGLVRALREGDDAKTAVARALGDLAYANGANRVLIAEAGGIPPLVDLLRAGSANAKKSAARALRMLTRTKANQAAIAEAGGIPPLVELQRDGRGVGSAEATWALERIARDNDANAVAIAVTVGLKALVQLARHGRMTVNNRLVVRNAGIAAKRKAALVVAALLRDRVPAKVRNQTWVRYLIRRVIGPYL